LKSRRKLFLFPFNCYHSTELLLKSALATGAQPQEILYLTPSPRKLRATQLLFAQLIGQRAFITPMFRTTGQLAREICSYSAPGRFFPSELKPLLIRWLLAQKGRRVTIGYARAIGDFIGDVKKHIEPTMLPNIPAVLNQMLAGYEIPLKRAQEAYTTLEEYNKCLRDLDWLDSEDTIDYAARNLARRLTPPRVLILDSFIAPNRLEQRLLSALIDDADITLAGAYWSEKEQSQYALAQRFIGFINSHTNFVTEEAKCCTPAAHPKARVENPCQPLYRFPTPDDEIIGVSREILNYAQKSGFDSIYVVLPRLVNYGPLVNRIFRQYNIPFTIYPKNPLSSSPPIVAVLELLNALDRDYERVATACAFSSPFFPRLLRLPDDRDDEARNRAANLINTLSCRAGIIKGRDNWYNIGQRLIEAEEELPEKKKFKEFVFEFQSRVRQALGLTEKILEPVGTIGSQAQKLKQFLEAVDFCANLPTENEVFEQLNSDRKSLYDILDAISELEMELTAGCRFRQAVETRAEFIRLVKYLVGLGSKSTEPERGGVSVVEMEETLGLNPGKLFFAGLSETDLPGVYVPDPILPDGVRKKLGMPDMDWHRDWQQFHFYRTLKSSPNPPFLSYPETRDGRPVLPTPFIEDEPVRYQAQKIIFSEVEEQIFCGMVTGRRFDGRVPAGGFSGDGEVAGVLDKEFGEERVFSVTELERYIFCPYQFYLTSVLGLERAAEPAFEVEGRIWGLIAHKVLARVYQEGAVPVPEFKRRAEEVVDKELAKIGLPRFWAEVTRRVLLNLFEEMLACEEELRGDFYVPFAVEREVGGLVDNKIRVRGRIDRIDARLKPCPTEEIGGRVAAVRLIDYKTGRVVINRDAVIKKGTHIQLPIYAYLFLQEQGIKEEMEGGRGGEVVTRVEVDNIGIYSLRDVKLVWLANKGIGVASLIEAAKSRTVAVVNGIRMGSFFVSPADEEKCKRCSLSFTCPTRLKPCPGQLGNDQ